VKKIQAERLLQQHLAPRFEELRVSGDLLIAREGRVLRGFAVERSQMSKTAFRLRVFTQLLSVPATSVRFGLSQELGNFQIGDAGRQALRLADAQIHDRGREFLAKARDCETLVSNLDFVAARTADPRLLREIRAHCLIDLGDDDGATQELGELARELEPPEVEYERAALVRAQELMGALSQSHEAALALLDAWTEETAEALAQAEGLSSASLQSETPPGS
jgi:hypothetical protein